MLLATINSGLYKFFLVCHILVAIVGLGAVMLNGLYGAEAKKRPGPNGRAVAEANHRVTQVATYFIYGILLFGILLVGVGLFIRLRVLESPLFATLKETRQTSRMPIVEVLRSHTKNVLLAMGARFAENVCFYVFSVFILSYAVDRLKMGKGTALLAISIASALELFTIPTFGALSDRVGRRPVYMIGAALTGLIAFPFFWLAGTQTLLGLTIACILGLTLAHAAMYGPQAAFFSELFGTSVRCTGASLGYQLASPLAGGLAPLIATALLQWSGGAPWPVALYMIATSLITLVSLYLVAETSRADLS